MPSLLYTIQSQKRTHGVGPCHTSVTSFPSKVDTSLRWTVGAQVPSVSTIEGVNCIPKLQNFSKHNYVLKGAVSGATPLFLFTVGKDKLNCLKSAPKIYPIIKRNS